MSRINTTSSTMTDISMTGGSSGVPPTASTTEVGSWYEAMSKAWGAVLDGQAGKVTSLAESIGQGQDTPANITLLTAESLKMQFLSSNASTSTNSVGQALESLARK